MLDHALVPRGAANLAPAPALAGALEHVAAAFGRLDQALSNHPLRPAFLYRARLEAVRRQAAVDGKAIDPWHFAALLEGFRLRMDSALRIIDRGMIFEAARHAFGLHQWITGPDFDQEGDVRCAEKVLAHPPAAATPLLSAALRMYGWLAEGGARAPFRAALIRYWTKHRLLQTPVPLTAPRALGADVPFDRDAWIPLFLEALADEASDALQLLFDMERSWFAARAAVAGRRSTSRAAAAIDIMAATPLVSATTLAAGLGMAIKNAAAMLDAFAAAGVVVEVTHRSMRRLFGLSGLEPLRDKVAPPLRPEAGRGRGRPPAIKTEEVLPLPPLPERPLSPIERKAIDYSDLERWMAHAEQVIRGTRRALDSLVRSEVASATVPSQGAPALQPDLPSDDPPDPWLVDDQMAEHE